MGRKSLKTSQIEARLKKLIEGTPAALKPPTIMDIEHRLKNLLQTPTSSASPSNNYQITNLSSNSPNKAPFLKAWSISQNTKPEDLIQAATEELKITGAMDKIIEDQRKEQDSVEKILQSNSKTKTETEQNLTNFTVKKPINEMNPD